MSRVLPLVVTLAALLGSNATQAQNLAGDIKACRLMTDTARRLACYDGVQLPAEPSAATAAVAPAVLAAPAAAPVVAADPVAKFGQETVKQSAATELKQIESRIPGSFHGWRAGSQLTLENGQVWRIADGSEAIYELQNPKVTVHRGMLGAFYLEIEGVGFQMRVTRVR